MVVREHVDEAETVRITDRLLTTSGTFAATLHRATASITVVLACAQSESHGLVMSSLHHRFLRKQML